MNCVISHHYKFKCDIINDLSVKIYCWTNEIIIIVTNCRVDINIILLSNNCYCYYCKWNHWFYLVGFVHSV